jgi:large subunit ribosomal protein L15
MQIHQVKRNNPYKNTVKVGRGGKRGKTSGRGHKGQNARAGTSGRPEIRDMIKKLPKLRGRGVNMNKAFRQSAQAVSLTDLENNFSNGERVLPSSLFAKNLIKKEGGKLPRVKILNSGEITKKLEIKNCEVSKTAKEAIEKAGGTIK